MPDADIPFPLTSAPGKRPHDSAGRLINVYAEDLVVGARTQTVWRRAPGLTAFSSPSVTDTGWRGGIVVGGSQLYGAFSNGGGRISSFNSSGNATFIGAQAGTKKLFWAHNNKFPPDVVYCDPDNGPFQVTPSAVINYPDTNAGFATSVCFLDGYFFFTQDDGNVIASQINDTVINPLDFIQVQGNPGGLYRAIPFSELYLCGSTTIEVWQNTAQAVGFPFSRVKVIPRGLIGRYALTGWEPGFGKGVFFVGDDRIVYVLNGYQPLKISTPDVDRAIAYLLDVAGGTGSDIELYPYVANGHSYVVLNMPTSTWTFDVDALRWHERQSYLRANWRPLASVNAFNRWLAGDALGPGLIEISEKVQTELGQDIVFELWSGPVTAFPNRLRCAQVTLSMALGTGINTGPDPRQVNPMATISWSDDAGVSWSSPLMRRIGPQATSLYPVRINRCGQTRDQGRRWKVQVFEPVDVELTGGKMSSETRNY
jgi:hypothetical protein